ncbi:MAG: MlaD family protein [Candidatus Omnitrophota bacterium]
MQWNNETRVGVLVLLALVVLGALTWRAGNFEWKKGGYEIKAQFKNIEGVTLNAPVTLNGLEVGRVSGIDIIYGDKTLVELTLWLNEDARLHGGARAVIKNLGFMGEKYVSLAAGDDEEPFLKPGEVIQGSEPVSFEEILGRGSKIAGNLESISQEVDRILQANSRKIDLIIEHIETTSRHTAEISANVEQRLQTNEKEIDMMVQNLNRASRNLEEMSYDLKENPWKLLYKDHEKKSE